MALIALMLSVVMSFISQEATTWGELGRLSILLLLGAAWWGNESQVDF